MVRDWHKDMELLKDITSMISKDSVIEIALFYLQGYKDLHQQFREYCEDEPDLFSKNMELSALLDQAELREAELRKAIEEIINEKSQWGDAENALDVVTGHLSKTLASLYPEEEKEAKTFTFDAILHIYNGIRTTVSKEQMAIEAKSADEAEKRLREMIEDRYKNSTHLLLSSLQLELVKEEDTNVQSETEV